MKLLMKKMEEVAKENISMLESRDLNKKVTYFMSCLVAPLGGSKGFIMDSAGFQHHIGKGKEGPLAHAVIPLMGRFKRETDTRHPLLAVINKTASNLNVRWWLERFNDELISKLQRNFPSLCDEKGNLDQASQ